KRPTKPLGDSVRKNLKSSLEYQAMTCWDQTPRKVWSLLVVSLVIVIEEAELQPLNGHSLGHQLGHGVEKSLDAMFLFKSAASRFQIFGVHSPTLTLSRRP
ncbi:hypothetical protein, partial [Neorhizobium huautlense]|uniref:hypothetical protein n=1 Tax=Neorhizobium huautlense TaxID=67774 RepID=UPI0027D8BF3A